MPPDYYLGLMEGSGPASIPLLAFDIMETHYGEWFTMEQLVARVQVLRPEAKPGSVKRGVERLKQRGLIETDMSDKAGRYRVPTRAYLETEAS